MGVSYGPYEIIEIIASGGMGKVYRARHVDLDRTVALKLVKGAGAANDERHLRFQREAQAVARLHHPNIVPIYEVGEVDGECYFAMRLVDGPPLNQYPWKRESRSDFIKIATVLAKTAEAVHFAHQHGILHRDIKPGNVLLDSNGEPHLTDFGLARFIEEGSNVTQTNSIMGTPHYMAPEQIEGPAADLTSTADIYGLGAILFELMTGGPPFKGESTMGVLKKVIEAPVPNPQSENARVPGNLATIVTRSLSKKPTSRYASANEFAADLRRFNEGLPILARRVTPIERLNLFIQRRPLVAGLIAIATFLLLIVSIGSPLVARHQFALRRTAEASQSKSDSLATELLHKNYQYAIRLAQSHIDGARPHLAPPLLWRTDPKMRGWEWGHLMAQCPIDSWTFDFGQRLNSILVGAKDGTNIFFEEPGGTIGCLNTSNRNVRWTLSSHNHRSIDSDPLGRYLAISRQVDTDSTQLLHGIEVLNGETGDRIVNLEPHQSSRALWSSDGRKLYTFSHGIDQSHISCYSIPSFQLISRKESSLPIDISSLRESQLTENDTYFVGFSPKNRQVFEIPLDNPSLYKAIYSGPPGGGFKALNIESNNGHAFYARSRQIFRQHPDESQGKMIFDSPGVIIRIILPKSRPNSALICTGKELHLVDETESNLVMEFPEKIVNTMFLEDETLMTLSETGVIRVHSLPQTPLLPHAIQASPGQGAEGRQIELSDDASLMIFQDWRNRSFFLGRWQPGKKVSFEEINYVDLGHIRTKNATIRPLPIFRPASREIVTRTETAIRFFSLDSSPPALVREIDIGSRPFGVRFDRSGQKLVYSLQDELMWFDLETNKSKPLISPLNADSKTKNFPITEDSFLHLQPSGQYAAIVNNGRILVCRTNDGAVCFEKTFDVKAQICLYPTAPMIAYSTFHLKEPIYIYDFEEKRNRSILTNHQRTCQWMQFSPDGGRLFVNSTSPGQVAVWDWRHNLELLGIANETGAQEGEVTQDGYILASTDYNPSLHLRFALPWHHEYNNSAFQKSVTELRNRLTPYPQN